MAVIVKYIVVRNGVEKMTFVTKKEADAHDKMLDIADNIFAFLKSQNVKLQEQDMENISLLLAENRDNVMALLRGGAPQPEKKSKSDSAEKKNPGDEAKATPKTRPGKAPKAPAAS
ncbi:MAG: YebG family protein [Pseudomonadota bacterium]